MKEIKVFAFILTVLIIASCNSGQDESVFYTSGVYEEFMDTTVVPGNDFHAYVNGTWIKNMKIPADKSSYGIAMILHDNSQDDVKGIIEELASTKNEVGSDEQMVGGLYASYMDMEKRNALGFQPIQAELSKIDMLGSHNDLPGYFGYANSKNLNNPIGFMVVPDMKEPTLNSLYTWQGGLALPDREYYLSEAEKMVSIRDAYKSHITTILKLIGVENAESKAITVMKIETQLAKAHWPKEDNRNLEKLYNRYSKDSLKLLMPDFSWDSFFGSLGSKNPEFVVMTQVSYFQELNNIIKNTSIENWKTYLRWIVINDAATVLNEEIDNQNFEFYNKTLRGAEEQLPRWRRAVNAVNANLGEVVGKV